jgi:hypothetical protein
MPSGNWDTHGILIKDGGETSNQLYKNELSNLTAGSIGLGNNAETVYGLYGLKFLCNLNTQNTNDFELRRPETGFSYASRHQHGSTATNLAAGNTFSGSDGNNNNFVHLDFYSDGWYDYKFVTQSNQIPHPDEVNVANGFWNLYNSGLQNNCPTNFPEGIIKLVDIVDGINEHGIIKENYYNLLYSYHGLIDEGNTEGMVNDIVISWPEDAWELRNELMARSPYNSEEVLGTAIDQNIMPQGMLLEVLLANPDALRKGNLISHVQCCIANPFPSYMIDMLNAAQQGQTVRTLMEENLSTIHLDMANSHKRVVQHYLNDSLGFAPDVLLNWLKEMNTLEGRGQPNPERFFL